MSKFLVTATHALTESCTISIDAINFEESLKLAREIFDDPLFQGKWEMDDFVGKDTFYTQKQEPIGAECLIQLLNDGKRSKVYISFGAFTEHHQHDGYGVNDDSIYYYTSAGEGELQALTLPANADDFVILNYELVYEWPTKATYGNNGFAIPNDVGNYKVLVMRLASESCELLVKAGSEESAREHALLMVKSDDFIASSWKLDDEIGSIQDVVVTKCS